MVTISQLLREKGTKVWAIRPDATIFDALDLMKQKDIGVVLVMDRDALVGILSERDCARKVLLPGKNAKDTAVAEVMTSRVLCVSASQSAEECMGLMTEKHIRHLPVVGDKDQVIGVVSIGDIGRVIIAQQEFTIAHLEHYITGAEAMFYRSS
jgi:CBS domain-containing protein